MRLPVSITFGSPRADADTAALIDDALTLLAKRREEHLPDPSDVLARIHLLASLRAQITTDIAVVADLAPDTLNEHYNRDDNPEPIAL